MAALTDHDLARLAAGRRDNRHYDQLSGELWMTGRSSADTGLDARSDRGDAEGGGSDRTAALRLRATPGR
jgi:hypothetical protein